MHIILNATTRMCIRQQIFGVLIMSSSSENNNPLHELHAIPNRFAHNITSSFFHYPTKSWSCIGTKLQLGKLENLPRIKNFEMNKSLSYKVGIWKVVFAKFTCVRKNVKK